MSDSCKRFFDIPELVDLLTANLDKEDISRLARTCRRMNRSCTPSLFRSLTVDDKDEFSLFISTPALHTLARNIQHVKTLEAGAQELAYYYNCVLALEEITSPTTGTPAARQPWLPPPDIRTCQIVALPPMTRLSQLTLHLGINGYRPYSLPSARDSQALLAQLCWVVSLNPGLKLLNVEDITIESLQDGRLLARTISGMSNIDDLDLGVAYSGDYLELGSYLFYHCPPSIRKLSIAFPRIYDANPVRFEDRLEEEDAECTRRLAPLINLEELAIWGSEFQPSTVGIRSVFDHCPNIKRLDISTCAGRQETIAMAEHIAKACPKIESLVYRLSLYWSHDPLPLRIMDSLPDQQISYLEYNGTFFNSSNNSANISFQRHSTALRQILIDGKTRIISQISISTILKECRNLEILYVPFDGLVGHYTTLTDVLEHPWSCTKLQQLTLALNECKLPIEFGLGPYYARTTPITLSAVETWHFARLENLYRQIGALTDLKVLNLGMVETNEQGLVVPSRRQTAMLMPAMLSLGSVWRRIPGYLHHFSGLKKLTSLLGAVNVGGVEATLTIGWKEAVWMDDHWPELEYAGFFNRGSRVSSPFEWLRDKRNLDGRKELELEDCENGDNSDSEFDDDEISAEDDDIDMHD